MSSDLPNSHPASKVQTFIGGALTNPAGYTIADQWEGTCDRFPTRCALKYVGCERFPESEWTFSEVDAMANQIASWASNVEGLKKDDVVALYMENRAEYVVTWLGLCKAGITIAFINNTIKGVPLIHSIKICDANLVVFGIESTSNIEPSSSILKEQHGIESVCFGGVCSFTRSIDSKLYEQPRTWFPRTQREGVGFSDTFGFIYTSGTTGLPKAVRITHLRMWCFAASLKAKVNEHDDSVQ